MSPKIHHSFWMDEIVESLDPESKLVFLWLITNPQTNLIGVCHPSPKRFQLDTGLPLEALERALKGLGKAVVVVNGFVFIRNFIHHQFGRGEKLVANNVFKSICSHFQSLKDEELQCEIVEEYPEIGRACKPLQAQREGERERTRKENGETEGESVEARANALLVLAYLNQKAKRRFTESDFYIRIIAARLRETQNDVPGIKQMIDRQCAAWIGTQTEDYLRPKTLFGPENFRGYYDDRSRPVSKMAANRNGQSQMFIPGTGNL